MPFDGTVHWVLTHAEEARDLLLTQQQQVDQLQIDVEEARRRPPRRIDVPDVIKPPWWRIF